MDSLFESPLPLYAGLVVVMVVLPTVRARAFAAAGLGFAALGIAADRAGGAAPNTTFTTINQLLIGAGAALTALAALRAWRERGTERPRVDGGATLVFPGFLLPAGILLAALGPDLSLSAAGIFLTFVYAAAVTLRLGRRRWLIVVAAGAALLGAGFFLLLTILGPGGGAMREIVAGPFSPPAERLLVLLIGLGSLLLAGLFPFHRAPWKLALAPIPAILLVRVLLPGLPDGLDVWQPPAMLWLAGAVAAAALAGRWSAAAVAGGLLTLWSGTPQSILPGLALVLFGWLAGFRLVPPPQPIPFRDERRAGIWFAIPAAALPPALTSALGAEVLTPVLALLAVVVGLLAESRRR